MNITDIEKVLNVAATENLQLSARQLHLTPGALSKIIKRVEATLHVQLFDRLNNTLKLNQHGKGFVRDATQLLLDYQQIESRYQHEHAVHQLTIAGPPVIINYWFFKLFNQVNQQNLTIQIKAAFEGHAVKLINQGMAHIAIVTGQALSEKHPDLHAVRLSGSVFQVAADKRHPILQKYSDGHLPRKDLDALAFAVPAVSPFCGIERGIGSDGWRDDKIPRLIRYRCDDFDSLIKLVKQGWTLSYLPDYVIQEEGFSKLTVKDCPFTCHEDIYLVWRGTMVDGWLNKLINELY
ncbi:LysR family transcriptional regulator [Alteromonas ponticola]|uniref:LysR family transcriptional regulator n=1 Tax=Alteromonas ponticola TaxID=2720613 RepID=A0ABX1QYW9_9ALTE|nr:LysR family transcriptional regulator [Alteromonas ponticola]NMH59420.1 LysR family transcriptional regulator [Alteromonas ponticola]